MYEQDAQTLSDEHLFKYLHDYRTKEKCLYKLNEINMSLKVFLNDFPADLFVDKNSFINKTSKSAKFIPNFNSWKLKYQKLSLIWFSIK